MRTRALLLLTGWLAALPLGLANTAALASPSRGSLPSRHATRPLLKTVSLKAYASDDPLAWGKLVRAEEPLLSVSSPVKSAQTVAHLVLLAEADYREGRMETALAHYQTACRLAPKDAYLHGKVADLFYMTGQCAQAMAEYRAAIRLKPTEAETHWGLGIALLQTDLPEAGIAECRAALHLKPGDAAMHNSLGLALYQKGQKAEARQEWQAALALRDPDGCDCAHRYLAEFSQ